MPRPAAEARTHSRDLRSSADLTQQYRSMGLVNLCELTHEGSSGDPSNTRARGRCPSRPSTATVCVVPRSTESRIGTGCATP